MPAQAGIQLFLWWALGPRFRGDERRHSPRLDIHLAHAARVLLRVRARELGEALRIAADWLGPGLEQCVTHRLFGEGLVALGIEPRDDRGRRAHRREGRKPGLERHTR